MKEGEQMGTLLIILAIIAIIAIGFALYYRGLLAPELFFRLFALLDCCSTLVVFGVTIVFTVSAFLLWHSLFVAALLGGSSMTAMLLVLSIAAASYKPESQSS
jgi:predicted membrane protein